MSAFTPRRLREILERAGRVTAETAESPERAPFGGNGSGGEAGFQETQTLEPGPFAHAAPAVEPPVVPALPGPLERLVRAAANADGAWGPAVLEGGLVLELREHVLAWAAAHLLGDRDALARLWAAYAAWAKGARA